MILNKFWHFRRFIYKRLFLKINSALIILIGFAIIILLGAAVLSLPVSSSNGQFTHFLNALFTATSAACVTGRVLYDTGTYWSEFGHIVILVLIQIGGLGFMSMWILFMIVIKKRVSPKTRLLMAKSINLSSTDGIFRLAKFILAGTFACEALGAVILSTRFIPLFGITEGIKMSLFHSVSAFCNAGMDVMGNYSGVFSSMTAFRNDAVVNITLTSLVIMGGIGFFVWKDVFEYVRYVIFRKKKNKIQERKMLSLYTKLVLVITTVLIIAGTGIFLISEWNNDHTIGNESVSDKIMISYFHSVSCRSAGFNSISIESCNELTKLSMIFLMFIGASSGSTGGGIKTVTFGIIVIAVFQISIGNSEIVVFGRTINKNSILRGMALTSYVLVMCVVTAALISIIENMKLIDAMFEAVAAFTTVGYTFGGRHGITVISKILIIVSMFIGRVGILTFTFGILLRMSKKQTLLSYPEENIFIG